MTAAGSGGDADDEAQPSSSSDKVGRGRSLPPCSSRQLLTLFLGGYSASKSSVSRRTTGRSARTEPLLNAQARRAHAPNEPSRCRAVIVDDPPLAAPGQSQSRPPSGRQALKLR
jgi:hypothetical protein